jgi:hypothetical protein
VSETYWLQVAEKRTQVGHPPIPGFPRSLTAFRLLCPCDHQLDAQRAVVMAIGDEGGEAGEQTVPRVQRETKPTALGQIVIDALLKADGRAHD